LVLHGSVSFLKELKDGPYAAETLRNQDKQSGDAKEPQRSDLDRYVDRTDAALFTPHLGLASGSVWATGDFDGDAATTLDDFALLQSNFGASAASPVAATAVPEPASLALALVGAAAVYALAPRRRFRHNYDWRK